jgi:microcompartment protein CcmK/EutM
MKRGVIVGEIWASRRVADLAGRSLKLVVTPSDPDALAGRESQAPSASSTKHGEPGLNLAGLAWESLTVAIDTLDARAGQDVLVAYGSGARSVLSPGPHNRHLLCDAAVALLIDSPTGDARSTGAELPPLSTPPKAG